MSNTFLAVYVGSGAGPRMKAWAELSQAEQQARQKQGV